MDEPSPGHNKAGDQKHGHDLANGLAEKDAALSFGLWHMLWPHAVVQPNHSRRAGHAK
jgi:hypothetical protein